MSIFKQVKRRVIFENRREARFWERVQKRSNGCWLYTGHKGKDGYGSCRTANSSKTPAHRYAYCLGNGVNLEDIEGWLICHRCDVRACVNPAHLYRGTPRDNANDMIARQRCKGYTRKRKIGFGGRKLTEGEVKQMREEAKGGASYRELSERYGVTGKMTVSDIVNRKSWSWLE